LRANTGKHAPHISREGVLFSEPPDQSGKPVFNAHLRMTPGNYSERQWGDYFIPHAPVRWDSTILFILARRSVPCSQFAQPHISYRNLLTGVSIQSVGKSGYSGVQVSLVGVETAN